MEITPKIKHVEGSFDTKTGELVCVPSKKNGTVQLCLKSDFNLPIAEIRIYDSERYVDFVETFDDASKLGKEICRRFNQFPQEGKL